MQKKYRSLLVICAAAGLGTIFNYNVNNIINESALAYTPVRRYENGVEAKYYETKKPSQAFSLTWQLTEHGASETQPLINANAGMIVNAKTGDILFEKDSSATHPIASLTKIMTAIVALENGNLDDLIKVTEEAEHIGENTMQLTANETYTLEELLYGLMLNSGNDAAYAIAIAQAGSAENFTYWMNIKAKELGLRNTKFFDPSGLDDRNYSTAQDLVKLTKYAMTMIDLREIVGTFEKYIEGPSHKAQTLFNQTNLLTSYPGVKGVKTGYTEAAGLCLVTFAENSGIELIGVVLNSNDRKGDMILMLDHGFQAYGITVEHNLLF